MSRKRKPKHVAQIQREAVPLPRGDIGTPELHQREVVIVNRGLARVVSGTTFDLYHHRGWIEDHHRDAAAELLRCAYAGGIIERGRSCISERIAGMGSYSEGEAAARIRFRKGMAALASVSAERLVYDVVVCNFTLRAAGKALKLHERDQMALLKDSLDDVARAFGIPFRK